MDVLYIPQLDEGDAGESPTAGRYRLLWTREGLTPVNMSQ